MVLSLSDETAIGEQAFVAVGLTPLYTPVLTGKGPWHIGVLLTVLPIGPIPAMGRVDLPFPMPAEDLSVVGLQMPVQGYVAGKLSNPAILTMDSPYLPATPIIELSPPEPSQGAGYGDTLALGDLNNDGITDLVVGAWFEDFSGVNKSGRVYVHWGPDFSTYMTLQPVSPVPFGLFGANLVIADITGDQVDDLVVGETAGSPPIPGRNGLLHVFAGGAGFSSTPTFSIPSLGTGEVYTIFGRILAAGDFNGDLAPDLAVGIHKATVSGFSSAGRIDVYWGPTYTTVQSIENPAPAAFDAFGVFLAVADLTGDGIDDLIEGSGQDDVGGVPNIGSVHTFAGPSLALHKSIPNPLPQGFNSRFGDEVHAADLDGDGLAEVITVDLKNRVYIFWSPDFDTYTGIEKPQALNTVTGNTASYGYFVETADVNGDGFRDVLISDVFEGVQSCASAKEGTLFTALGPFYSSFHVLPNPSSSCGDNFSWRITVGDVDGDAIEDVLMSSPTADEGGSLNSGLVYLFTGVPAAGQ